MSSTYRRGTSEDGHEVDDSRHGADAKGRRQARQENHRTHEQRGHNDEHAVLLRDYLQLCRYRVGREQLDPIKRKQKTKQYTTGGSQRTENVVNQRLRRTYGALILGCGKDTVVAGRPSCEPNGGASVEIFNPILL